MSNFSNYFTFPFLPVDATWPLPNFNRPHKLWALTSACIIPAVGVFSKILSSWLNNSTVYNREILIDALDNRTAGKSLITLSNHHSCMDDPLLWGLLDLRHYHSKRMRWSLGANDICFTTELHALFFGCGRTIPIVRGLGVYQKAMDFVLDRLNRGDWVHIFPEGKVNMVKNTMRYKWGVGRLISESAHCPVVIPIYHLGMDNILPNVPPYIPQIGRKLTVVIGKALHLEALISDMKFTKKTALEQRKIITDKIQAEMLKLGAIAQELHQKRS